MSISFAEGVPNSIVFFLLVPGGPWSRCEAALGGSNQLRRTLANELGECKPPLLTWQPEAGTGQARS